MLPSSLNNGHLLAYIGDSVMTLWVREYLIEEGYSKAKDLQEQAKRYISAQAQAWVLASMLEEEFLNEKEVEIYRLGRNYKGHSRAKNVSVQSYKMASGFEALWGYYYLSENEQRLEQIWNKTRIIVENKA